MSRAEQVLRDWFGSGLEMEDDQWEQAALDVIAAAAPDVDEYVHPPDARTAAMTPKQPATTAVYDTEAVNDLLRRATNVWVRRGELPHLAEQDWYLLERAMDRVRLSQPEGLHVDVLAQIESLPWPELIALRGVIEDRITRLMREREEKP